MPTIQSPFVSLALARLRRGVSICCWVVALSLLTQALVWCFATFTQVRYGGNETASAKPVPIVVSSDTRRAQEAAAKSEAAAQAAVANDQLAAPTPPPVGANDRLLTMVHATAQGAGTFAMMLMLPLLALGVLLGAGSATIGVEQTVSAFVWSIAIAMLVLPLGEFLNMPWSEGALTGYAAMTQQVEAQALGTVDAWGSATFYARFALLPIA